jgi:hypothetical protein
MSEAANLQTLITSLAYKYIIKGEVTHAHIPDDPFVESERRQVFFGAAIGIPTFFVHRNTANGFLMKILKETSKTRISHRYPQYLRVYNLEFRRALLKTVKQDAAALIEVMRLEKTMEDLENRLRNPQGQAADKKLTEGILSTANTSTPLKLSGEEFNRAAEKYYREELRRKHVEEAFDVFQGDMNKGEGAAPYEVPPDKAVKALLGERDVTGFLKLAREQVIDESASVEMLRKLIHICILSIYTDIRQYQHQEEVFNNHGVHAASVH